MQDFAQFPPALQMWVNDVLVWIGFGTLVGLLAKAIMPGRDPGGAIATLSMGIGGAVIGSGVFSLIAEGQRVTPVSPIGLVVATAGAFGLLFFYRLLGGHYFIEGEVPAPDHQHRRRRRKARSRRATVFSEE
jgi:uncharacterized membrane protein YeaQ/YmgE (transglycosylase-associated protein family)